MRDSQRAINIPEHALLVAHIRRLLAHRQQWQDAQQRLADEHPLEARSFREKTIRWRLKITRANAVAPMALSVPIGEALHVVMSSYDEGERVAMP